MSRSPLPPYVPTGLVLAGLLAGGCKTFDQTGSEYALGYQQSSSCATASGDWGLVGSEFTVELWLQAGQDLSYAPHPHLVWPGSFALWSDAEGIGYFSTTDVEPAGASYPTGWMDGDLHHIAGTYADGFTALYVDGQQVSFSTSTELGSAPGGELSVGCWGEKGSFEGLIDEIRVSAGVRYEESFDVVQAPFQPDEATVYLWHANEGLENVALDAMGRSDLTLNAIEWVTFSLGGDTGQ